MTDRNFWIHWHEQYDDPRSPRSRRLAAVRRQLHAALDQAPPGPIRLISMCAGLGLDVFGVLPTHPRRHDVHARLVEVNPDLVAMARATSMREGLDNVEIIEGDASLTAAYMGSVPADVLLVCGVFGPIGKENISRTILELPHLSARGATTIWTKEGNDPDLRPFVRSLFNGAGFEEIAYETEEGTVFGVGSHRWTGEPKPFRPGRQMFSFQPRERER